MIGIDWEGAHSMISTEGTLTFNSLPGLMLDPKKCSADKDLRSPKDPVPQGDGDIIHPRWTNGYVYTIVSRALDLDACASLEDSSLLGQELGLHLSAMLRASGRWAWTGADGVTRILDEARWFGPVKQSLVEGGATEYAFTLDSPFPYAISLTQTTPTISVAGSITNNGNVAFYPVIQVQGPATSWSVINDTTSQGIVYDDSRAGAVTLGGGDYAEIDTFKNTIFKNGSGADMSAGVDPTLTDFYALVPGVNNLESNGADSIYLVNDAWS